MIAWSDVIVLGAAILVAVAVVGIMVVGIMRAGPADGQGRGYRPTPPPGRPLGWSPTPPRGGTGQHPLFRVQQGMAKNDEQPHPYRTKCPDCGMEFTVAKALTSNQRRRKLAHMKATHDSHGDCQERQQQNRRRRGRG